MNKISIILVFVIIAGIFIIGGCSVTPDESRDSNGKQIPSDIKKAIVTSYNWCSGSFYDWSKQVEIKIFENSTYGQHNTVTVTIPEDYILIGGGAQIDYYGGAGAFLTASYPSTDGTYRTWIAQSKDHVYENFHTLYVEAIGMRLTDVNGNLISPAIIKEHLKIKLRASLTKAMVREDGYSLLSGGGRVLDPFTVGRLLTACYKGYNYEFSVTASALYYPCENTIQAYGLYYDNNDIAGFGKLYVSFMQVRKNTYAGKACRIYPETIDGYVISGVGGLSTSNSRFLFSLSPVHPDGTYGGYVADKDHVYSANGTLDAFVNYICKTSQ